MTLLDGFIQHLTSMARLPERELNTFSLNLLLGSLIFELRPQRVLELGMGTAEASVGMLHMLNAIGTGRLTIVDDWARWDGRKPEGMDRLMGAGAILEAPVSLSDYACRTAESSFDLVVCRSELCADHALMDRIPRLLSPGGRMVIHGLAQDQRSAVTQRFMNNFQTLYAMDTGGKGPGWILFSRGEVAATPSPAKGVKENTANPLYLGLVQGDGYGWGVCSRYLIAELSAVRPTYILNDADGSATDSHLNGPLFQAIVDVHLNPMFPEARGRVNVGYTFFENELTDISLKNARRFDLVLGGSTWCAERLREKGIGQAGVLIQGIDPHRFYPIEETRTDDRFVIFSGGKLELRKGQDLVLRAVKIMQDKYPDVWLVNCWYNLWPASTRLMVYSRHIRFEHHEGEPWQVTMARTYAQNGLDPARIITHDLVPQESQRAIYAQTDIGLFPNRCEGGTNLVLMEYMACAKPVIVSNTSGHRDIVNSENALLLDQLSNYHVIDRDGTLIARWQEPDLDEIIERLEYAYHHRDELRGYGDQAGRDLHRFTWQVSAAQLLRSIDCDVR